jgi:hypothetical protein
MTTRALALIALIALSAAADGAVSERPSPVEVVNPIAPQPVIADGKQVLAYELHITNFGKTPLVLRHLEVFGDGEEILDLSADALTKSLVPIGDAAGNDVTRIDVGRRVIVFVWIARPPLAAVPRALQHRLTFDIVDAQPATQSVIDGIVVPVTLAPVPILRPPFKDGDWLAGSGPSNASVHRRSLIAVEGRASISQRFAIDWVLVGKNGNTFHDRPDRNENFWAFGQPVHAVADGEVTEVIDTFEDNTPRVLPPVTIENILGNHVIVRIAPHRYVMFAHLRQHSIRVRLHQRVKAGTLLGEAGNSGNSTGAHLHMQVMTSSSALSSEGVPFVFNHFQFLGYGHDFKEDRHPNEPRMLEMPLDDEVIRVH